MRPVSLRHAGVSGERRAPQEHEELSKDQVEQLAAAIVDRGSEYILEKEGGEEALPDISAAVNVDPEAMANKLIKEAAREMARDEGRHHHPVHEGSTASWAQRVKAKKDDKDSIEHKVAERVKEKLEDAQEREGGRHHTFTGPGMTSASVEHGRG